MAYRPEIDGLRALAVVPVILFHAGDPAFGGGYVGVDVFFVISGYLIGTIVMQEREAGTFSLLRFYERRARRILPALTVVMLACLPFAWAWMLPYELAAFGRSLAAVALFASNILFWQESGYFAANADTLPLLHTWSLAVEEQFYILFPLAMMAFWRLGRRILAALIALAALLSLGLAEWTSQAMPFAGFYLLPSRAWELLAGVLLALHLMRRPVARGLLAEAGALAGVALILFAVLRFDADTPFPSLLAVVPVAGTGLLILCAGPGTLIGRLLAARLLVGIGLVSYPLYLWHQPLFAFARLQSPEPLTPHVAAALILLAFVLAVLTWRFVERPMRNRARFTRGRVFGAAGLATLGVIAGGVALTASGGVPHRYPDYQRGWITTGPLAHGDYVRGAYIREALGAPMSDTQPNLVLLGDSFSQDAYNMIRESGAFAGHAISAIYIPAACQLYLGPEDISDLRLPRERQTCAGRDLKDRDLAVLRRANTVILAMHWRDWAVERLPRTLDAIGFGPEQTVLVLGPKAFEPDLRRLLSLSADDLPLARAAVPEADLRINARLAASLPPDRFIDVLGRICGPGNTCPLFTPAGALISYDGSHLTPEGAAYLGRHLFGGAAVSALSAPPVLHAARRELP